MDNKRDERCMTIGAFAQATRLSPKALRLYDRFGILRPALTDPGNGYRYYTADQLAVARLIRWLRDAQLPLAAIRTLVTREPEAILEAVQAHGRQVQTEARRVQRVVQQLVRTLQSPVSEESPMSSLNVTVVELAPQLVAGILKHVTIDALEAHIQESPRRLGKFAQAQGAEIVGGAFGIFHGCVSESDNGPMEVCLPVKGPLVPSGDIVLREMPGGKAVRVVGGGEYCQFPKVLELYDTACDWARKNEYEVVGPPRELWTGPNGEECTLQVVWLLRERSVSETSAGPGGAGSGEERPE